MHRAISVSTHDAKPAVDRAAFHISRIEADTRIDTGYAVWLSPASIQTRAPGWTQDEEKLLAGGMFREAWKPRYSDHYLVMQLVVED